MARTVPVVALVVAALLLLAAPAGAAQVYATGLACGADAEAGTLQPTADAHRDTATSDERVAVQLALMDGATVLKTLGTGMVQPDGSVPANGTGVVASGITRQFRPASARFGDGSDAGGTVERGKTYKVRVRVFDFDDSGVDFQYYDCTVPAAPPKDVTLTVELAGAGSGGVTAIGISCPPSCSAKVPVGTKLTLSASPGGKSAFAGWGAPECPGASSTCTLELTTDRTVQARFDPAGCAPRDLNKEGETGALTSATIKDVVHPRGFPLSVRTKMVLTRLNVCELGAKGPPYLDGLIDPLGRKGWVLLPVDTGDTFEYNVLAGAWTGLPPQDYEVDPSFGVTLKPIDLNGLDLETGVFTYDMATISVPSYTVPLVDTAAASLTATTDRIVDVKLELEPPRFAPLLDPYLKTIGDEAVDLVALQLADALRNGMLLGLGPRWESFPGFVTPVTWRPLLEDALAMIEGGRCAACTFERLRLIAAPLARALVLTALTYLMLKVTVAMICPASLAFFPLHRDASAAQAQQPAAAALKARRLARLGRRGWTRGRLPSKRAYTALSATELGIPGARIRGASLLVSPAKLTPGRTVKVAVVGLPKGRHEVPLTLAGPGGVRHRALLPADKGAAGATVTLPRRLAKGTWTLVATDGTALDVQGTAVTGRAEMRAATFRVR
ncbi:MAG: hypothetical protein HZB46_03295 [Solirubrobacterales bacterium]|nr:hypothetical protein [Solirubrobacterales bacterium]